jgi:hypothetical protein
MNKYFAFSMIISILSYSLVFMLTHFSKYSIRMRLYLIDWDGVIRFCKLILVFAFCCTQVMEGCLILEADSGRDSLMNDPRPLSPGEEQPLPRPRELLPDLNLRTLEERMGRLPRPPLEEVLRDLALPNNRTVSLTLVAHMEAELRLLIEFGQIRHLSPEDYFWLVTDPFSLDRVSVGFCRFLLWRVWHLQNKYWNRGLPFPWWTQGGLDQLYSIIWEYSEILDEQGVREGESRGTH